MKIPKLHSLQGLFEPSDRQAMAPVSMESDVREEDDPQALFRRLIGPVRKLADVAEPARPPPPAPDAAMSRADEAHVLVELAELPNDANLLEAADRMLYLANGYPPKILRKLRRGQFKVQDEIDLHHLPQSAAKVVLSEFLLQAKRRQLSCLRLVHGKGLRSGERGPVIKNMLDQDLRRRSDVIAFTSAPLAQGGTGALLLLLKNC
jgi:DNA-nicking Smr family endonuclease